MISISNPSETLLLKNLEILGADFRGRGDILIADNRIMAIGEKLTPLANSREISFEGELATCGLADVHVHFRVPGNPEKETIETGTLAAAAGGFTTVCPMPNLIPAPDTEENLKVEQDLIDRWGHIDVRPFATITRSRKGNEIVDIEKLAKLAVGFSDDGNGVQDGGLMREAMSRIADADSILAAHCEDNSLLDKGYIHKGEYARLHGHRGICSESEWKQIERDLKLADDTGCRYHVCHISTRESVEIIRDAKKSGVNVSCETAPHYLWFTDMDLQEDGRFKMNPPIRSAADRKALVEGIVDGTIEVIATDHAPHTAEEKSRGLAKSLMGVVGLETSFGAVYTSLVKSGIISLDKMIELMSVNPRRIFRLGGCLSQGEETNLSIFDLNKEWIVNPDEFRTMGRSTPFAGLTLTGKPIATFYKGFAIADPTIIGTSKFC